MVIIIYIIVIQGIQSIYHREFGDSLYLILGYRAFHETWLSFYISVFEIIGKFHCHDKNRVQPFCYVMLWQIVTGAMQFFSFFQDLYMKYLKNSTIRTRLAFQKSVLERFGEKKSRIRETSNLSTDADRRTDTILERLRDLSLKKKKSKKKI